MKMTSEARIYRMASMFYYTKGSGYAAMLKKSKYNGHPEIDRSLGERFAKELIHTDFFDGIDCIVPVPMYRWKKFRRRFNQSEEIAQGIFMATGIPVVYNLEAIKPHKTQTRRSSAERATLPSDIFRLSNPEELAGKHILLVDDIVTTGGTVAACSSAIRKVVPSAKLSLLSLAHTAFS
ncbi:MAG: ComF family protein [Bacteroidales bacterium]|nr:ComF family protein [Bacteroidales bacterium]